MTPRENPTLSGHDRAEAALLAAAHSGKLPHAWLLTGPPGIGKATLAFRFARFLFAGANAPTLDMPVENPVFRRVAAETHADLSVVERSISPDSKKLRGEIVVDDVRAATAKFRMTAAEGGYRVILIDRADEMNRAAANALLKMLEEPPLNAILLLIAEAPGRLLPTIRSRCRRLALDPLDDAAMAAALAALLPDTPPAERAKLAAAAEGSPGAALALRNTDGAATAALVRTLLRDAATIDTARAYAVAETAAKTDEAFDVFMRLLRAAIARNVRRQARDPAAPPTLARWAETWHRLGPLHRDTLRSHLEKKEAVVQAVLALNPELS